MVPENVVTVGAAVPVIGPSIGTPVELVSPLEYAGHRG